MKLHAPLCDSVREKIVEQIERTTHLIRLLPADRVDAAPLPGAWPAEMLLGHLLDCLAGFCAVLQAAQPQQLEHFSRLRELPVNQPCSPEEAAAGIAVYRDHIEEGFRLLADADLARRVPTVFVPQGETLLTLLLGNLEHLVNHKHQLFACVRLLGGAVESRDLYAFRGE